MSIHQILYSVNLWRGLNNYINERNASEVTVAEKSDRGSGLNSKIVDLVNMILNKELHNTSAIAAITDAALLMAADGYGSGKVVGQKGHEQVIIRTSDTQKSFLHDKEPNIEELVAVVRQKFEKISKERDMTHG